MMKNVYEFIQLIKLPFNGNVSFDSLSEEIDWVINSIEWSNEDFPDEFLPTITQRASCNHCGSKNVQLI